MAKGGIPKFKRANFLRSLDPEQNKDPETFEEKFADKTKKNSYPIAWIDYYKELGKG